MFDDAENWESLNRPAKIGAYFAHSYQHKETKRYKYIVYVDGNPISCPAAETLGDAYKHATNRINRR